MSGVDGPEEGLILRLTEFAGIQTVYAVPMELGDYLSQRGWESNGEDLETPGYFVEVPEFGPGHMIGRGGYVFWVPADKFDATYSAVPVPDKRH